MASFMSPCVCRNLGKQPFLGTLQDNLIEMDILSASRHDGAYNDGYVTSPCSSPLCVLSLWLLLLHADPETFPWDLLGEVMRPCCMPIPKPVFNLQEFILGVRYPPAY